MALNRIQRYLERLYETTIQDNDDRIILVVGDEGAGKSTFILQAIWLYEQVRGNDPSPASVLNAVVFDDRDAFREKFLNAKEGDPIAVMDATHIMFKRESWDPDQIETEKQLVDIRIGNHPIFLGYQDWEDIPDSLQRRRAENAFYIPQRGYVKGFSRAAIDEKYSELGANKWPDPSLRDTFPSLEGTKLWRRFEEIDVKRKRERLHKDDEGEHSITPQDVVDDIISEGKLDEYVEVHDYQNRAFYSKPLIKYDYPDLSERQASEVKAALGRETPPEELVDVEGGEDNTPPVRG